MPRFVRPLLHGVVLLLALSGCASMAAPPTPLRLGLNIWSGYAPFYVADQRDLYALYPVQTTTFSSLYDSDRAFAQGRIDALGTTLFDALRLYDEGVRFKIVMTVDYSNGADGIVAAENVSSPRDLQGKRVAAEVGTVNHYVLLSALASEGLTESDVELVNLSVDEGAKAFELGKVDAAVLWEPFLSQQAARPGASKIFTSAAIPGRIVDVLLVREEVIEQHPDAVVGLIMGWDQALQLWRSQPQELIDGIARSLETTPEGLQSDLQGLVLVDLQENTSFFNPASAAGLHATYQHVAEFMLERQLLRRAAPEPDGILDSRFIEDALSH